MRLFHRHGGKSANQPPQTSQALQDEEESIPDPFPNINDAEPMPVAHDPPTTTDVEKEAQSKDRGERDDSSADSGEEVIDYPEGGLEAWTVTFGAWCAMGMLSPP